MNSRVSMCSNHRQMTWVWAQGTALGKTQAHSVTSGHEWVHISPRAMFKKAVEIIHIFLFIAHDCFLRIVYWGWAGSRWSLQTRGTQPECSCWPFTHSTVWFGGTVGECCCAGHLSWDYSNPHSNGLSYLHQMTKFWIVVLPCAVVGGPAVTSVK